LFGIDFDVIASALQDIDPTMKVRQVVIQSGELEVCWLLLDDRLTVM
jgi:hypothetical protein